jgi:hypothetical protein
VRVFMYPEPIGGNKPVLGSPVAPKISNPDCQQVALLKSNKINVRIQVSDNNQGPTSLSVSGSSGDDQAVKLKVDPSTAPGIPCRVYGDAEGRCSEEQNPFELKSSGKEARIAFLISMP